MFNTKTSIFAMVRKQADLDHVVRVLKDTGLRGLDISILFSDKHPRSKAIPNIRLTLGGSLGSLSGVGRTEIPGTGAFIAAGPLMTSIAGPNAGTSVQGIIDALAGMGFPLHEAQRYIELVQAGGFLVVLSSEDSEITSQKALNLLEACGATEISTSALPVAKRRNEYQTIA